MMNSKDAAYWIQKLALEPHPEGGYYRQTYRADLVLSKDTLPANFSGPRRAATAIYFLLDARNFSAFHRLQSDELWHFYLGGTLLVHVIEAEGGYSKVQLGNDPEAGEVLQAVVKAGCWFASEVLAPDMKDGNSFAVVGCTVAPGFDFEDFELAQREPLATSYPQHRKLIERLTRG
jgi:predicted cupin superfamily sugar epimerase